MRTALLHAQAQVETRHVGPPVPGGKNGENPRDDEPFMRQQREKQAKARNVQRQEEIVKETGRLLSLATQLNAEMNEANRGKPSADTAKKAGEIEKLARSVREKMRD